MLPLLESARKLGNMIDDVAVPVPKSLSILASTRLPKRIRAISLVIPLIGVWIYWR